MHSRTPEDLKTSRRTDEKQARTHAPLPVCLCLCVPSPSVSFDLDFAIHNGGLALSHQSQCPWVSLPLAVHLDPLCEALGCVVVLDGNGFLDDDGPAVDVVARRDVVDGAARDLDALLQHTAVAVEAGEGRQQGRVDVDDLVGPLAHKLVRQDAHETGKADELNVVADKNVVQGALEGRPVGKLLVVERHVRHLGGRGPLQPPDARHVRHHQGHLGWEGRQPTAVD
mmetsp:Transcript_4898/g.11416  ORF Transcript_4898/g.11416 Transcript_4898/m.11416 type:complete len:226 (+) Transcript_4898:773-1450(+)